MRGRAKQVGSSGHLMALMPVLISDGYREVMRSARRVSSPVGLRQPSAATTMVPRRSGSSASW